jgi:hypothetical protein
MPSLAAIFEPLSHEVVKKIKMKTEMLRVVSQGVVTYVPSSKEANGQLAKCEIRLKMLGGSKFGDEIVATLFGNLALTRYYEGDVVVAVLRFSVHEVNGALYQDVVCNDLVKLNA